MVKGLVISGLIGLAIGYSLVKLEWYYYYQEKEVKIEKEVNSFGIKKITKTKSYHLTKELNDSTRVFIDSTVWYEDQEMD